MGVATDLRPAHPLLARRDRRDLVGGAGRSRSGARPRLAGDFGAGEWEVTSWQRARLAIRATENLRGASISPWHGRPAANSSRPIPVPQIPVPNSAALTVRCVPPATLGVGRASVGQFPRLLPSLRTFRSLRCSTPRHYDRSVSGKHRRARKERREGKGECARTAHSKRRVPEFSIRPCRPTHSAFFAAPPLCTTTLQNPRAPRGSFPERGCVRRAPAAAGCPRGTPLILTGACGDSGPLRLVLGGHSRAPWVAAPPPCVHRVAVVLSAFSTAYPRLRSSRLRGLLDGSNCLFTTWLVSAKGSLRAGASARRRPPVRRYAMISFTTWPCTSVRRKSRPAWWWLSFS